MSFFYFREYNKILNIEIIKIELESKTTNSLRIIFFLISFKDFIFSIYKKIIDSGIIKSILCLKLNNVPPNITFPKIHK